MIKYEDISEETSSENENEELSHTTARKIKYHEIWWYGGGYFPTILTLSDAFFTAKFEVLIKPKESIFHTQ